MACLCHFCYSQHISFLIHFSLTDSVLMTPPSLMIYHCFDVFCFSETYKSGQNLCQRLNTEFHLKRYTFYFMIVNTLWFHLKGWHRRRGMGLFMCQSIIWTRLLCLQTQKILILKILKTTGFTLITPFPPSLTNNRPKYFCNLHL